MWSAGKTGTRAGTAPRSRNPPRRCALFRAQRGGNPRPIGRGERQKLVIEHPLDRPEAAWLAMVLGGPVLFLAGRARFEYEVFSRVSSSRWVAALVLLVLMPVLLRTASLVAAAVAAALLTAVAVADARRARGAPPEAAAPPF
ncbi:low temperature requirement protein A [Micromonospora sp. NPDC023814]|uniref:low temperature requirement protein A n=1 Tax=Micromonospora sp. NPDC023814 TaxID=3154596 RepID=UPI0033EB4F0E